MTDVAAHYVGIMGPCANNGKVNNPVTGTAYGWINPPGGGGELYGGYALDGILLRGQCKKMRDVVDGTSNTFLVGESSWDKDANNLRTWLRGGQNNSSACSTKNLVNAPNTSTPNFNSKTFSSNHVGGLHFAMADGSVTFLSENIDMGIYRSLSTREGGEIASLGN